MQLRKSSFFCLAHGVLFDNGVHPPCFDYEYETFGIDRKITDLCEAKNYCLGCDCTGLNPSCENS